MKFLTMLATRIVLGISVCVLTGGLLVCLARLSFDIRYLGLIDQYGRAGQTFPVISSLLWYFGPVAWWSYITPVALGIAIALRIQFPFRKRSLVFIILFVAIHSLVLFAACKPYFDLTAGMRIVERKNAPVGALVANLLALVAAGTCAGWQAKKICSELSKSGRN